MCRTSVREKYWSDKRNGKPPEILYHEENAKTFGQIDSKNSTVLKKILAIGNKKA